MPESKRSALEAAYVGNAAAGVVTGQESIRGQVILRSMGLGRLPVVNVENACASSSTALNQACGHGVGGALRHRARPRCREALPRGQEGLLRRLQRVRSTSRRCRPSWRGCRRMRRPRAAPSRPPRARARSARCSWTSTRAATRPHDRPMARPPSSSPACRPRTPSTAASTRAHSSAKRSRSSRCSAQPMIAEPLTRSMCSPIGDGAAAVVVVSERKARELGSQQTGARRLERAALGLGPRPRRAGDRRGLFRRGLRGGRCRPR